MPEPTSGESFPHYFHYALATLKAIKSETVLPAEMSPDDQKKAVQTYHQDALDRIIKDLEADAKPDPNPTVILGKALASLEKVDDMRFILQNLLEALKRADITANGMVMNTLLFYQHLGLTDLSVPSQTSGNTPPDAHNPLWWGGFLRSLGKWLDKVSLTLMELVVNAMKAIPRFVGIKPSLGLVGLVPSLSFELEAESVSLAELFETLRSNIKSGD